MRSALTSARSSLTWSSEPQGQSPRGSLVQLALPTRCQLASWRADEELGVPNDAHSASGGGVTGVGRGATGGDTRSGDINDGSTLTAFGGDTSSGDLNGNAGVSAPGAVMLATSIAARSSRAETTPGGVQYVREISSAKWKQECKRKAPLPRYRYSLTIRGWRCGDLCRRHAARLVGHE